MVVAKVSIASLFEVVMQRIGFVYLVFTMVEKIFPTSNVLFIHCDFRVHMQNKH